MNIKKAMEIKEVADLVADLMRPYFQILERYLIWLDEYLSLEQRLIQQTGSKDPRDWPLQDRLNLQVMDAKLEGVEFCSFRRGRVRAEELRESVRQRFFLPREELKW